MSKLTERRAHAISNDKKALLKRLCDARTVLANQYRRLFTPANECRFDFESKRLYSADESMHLQWSLRENPDRPESPDNQQTGIGVVLLFRA